MRIKQLLAQTAMCATALAVNAQNGKEQEFQTWALTPPMGWNSWDCYGPTVVETEVKANADYMAEHLLPYGWEYVVVDIRWFVENDKAGGYNQTNPIYDIDAYGRYTPAVNRFPSAADGVGFKALADYVHSKGLKFGIHLMRGVPKTAVENKMPILGTNGITCDQIANNDSICTWLKDNKTVDCTKPGAQEYYNSCFDMYAEWGVDFVKIDDLSRPYHTGEIELIHNAILQCGRPMVLSMSPGETPVEMAQHAQNHANMWRTVDDFWDNWSQLNYQFQVCAKWAPYIAPGTWPDADMLPLGKISIRGERGSERWTAFTEDEQRTMMNLWGIFKSPLMFGGDLPQNDEATNALLTNANMLYMHHYSTANRQVCRTTDNQVTWSAIDPSNGDRFVALFNLGGSQFVNTKDHLFRSGTISYLTTGYATDVDVALPEGTTELALVVTDGGDDYNSDHADWINPTVELSDGTTIDLTTQTMVRSTCGWGSIRINKNLNGGSLSIDGTKYSKGIATHANSVIVYHLPEGAVRFTAMAGIDNTGSDQGSYSSVEFMVFNYDPTIREETTDASAGSKTLRVDPARQVACSGLVGKKGYRKVDMSAPIAGAEKLYLVVTNGGDGLSYDHADWGNPTLVKADGTTVSLADMGWDANPINGWNAPKLNKNNDGNTMYIDGVKYTKGFGTNAPSMLTFTLPENHDYVSFTATVGYDDDVVSAPSGVSMEFRVFTSDPTPEETAAVPLDLTQLGFAEHQFCLIKEVWSDEALGTYSDAMFAPVLKSHASGLYRVSGLNRREGASLHVSVDKQADAQVLTFTVQDGETEGAYIQLLDNEKVIGCIPLSEDGTAVYTGHFTSGTHLLEARYSGTPSCKNATTGTFELSVNDTGVKTLHSVVSGVKVAPRRGSIIVTSTVTCTLFIYTPAGSQVDVLHIVPGTTTCALPSGLYVVNGETYRVR